MQMRICQEEDTPEASGYTSDVDTADCSSDREQGKCQDNKENVKIIVTKNYSRHLFADSKKISMAAARRHSSARRKSSPFSEKELPPPLKILLASHSIPNQTTDSHAELELWPLDY